MNRAELKTILKKNHVPDFKYNLDGAGRDDERLCLICLLYTSPSPRD